jgi:hypothetical protein
MRQIKIFKSVETEVTTLSGEVNDWIRSNRINVVRVSGNIAPQSERPEASGTRFPPSDVLILVEYEID